MGNNTISHKIDAYAQANLKALKQEEAKTGRKMTKFDIAQYMLQHGKLNKNEYANWMNTTEGFNAQAMTQQQKTALKQGSVWGFAGYGGGQESYLDSMTSFSQKTPVEQFNEIHSPRIKLNETVAERKKKATEIQKHIQEQKVKKQILHPNEALKEQKFKAEIDAKKITEEDKDKTAIELSKEIAESNEKYDITDVKKHPVASILTAPLRGAAYTTLMLLSGSLPQDVFSPRSEYEPAEENRVKDISNSISALYQGLDNKVECIEKEIKKLKDCFPQNFEEYNKIKDSAEFYKLEDGIKLKAYEQKDYEIIKNALNKKLESLNEFCIESYNTKNVLKTYLHTCNGRSGIVSCKTLKEITDDFWRINNDLKEALKLLGLARAPLTEHADDARVCIPQSETTIHNLQ